jgi:hypothetical protein
MFSLETLDFHWELQYGNAPAGARARRARVSYSSAAKTALASPTMAT